MPGGKVRHFPRPPSTHRHPPGCAPPRPSRRRNDGAGGGVGRGHGGLAGLVVYLPDPRGRRGKGGSEVVGHPRSCSSSGEEQGLEPDGGLWLRPRQVRGSEAGTLKRCPHPPPTPLPPHPPTPVPEGQTRRPAQPPGRRRRFIRINNRFHRLQPLPGPRPEPQGVTPSPFPSVSVLLFREGETERDTWM